MTESHPVPTPVFREVLRRGLFWVMLPIAAPQGLWLRRKATRLPGASGARQGACGTGEPLRLLALGDSIIDGVGADRVEDSLPVRFAAALAARAARTVHWRIEGTSGHGVSEVIERMDSFSQGPSPDVVLLSVGVNDVTGLTPTRHWRRHLKRLFGVIRYRWPGARILFVGLPPMDQFPLPPWPLRQMLGLRAGILDRIAGEETGRTPNARHVPTRIDPLRHEFCEDGFHPSAESCRLWAEELAGKLIDDAIGAPIGIPAGMPANLETRSTMP